MAAQLIDAQGVAEKFGRSRHWFYRNKRALERRGFPAPKYARLYSEEQVNDWINGKSEKKQANRLLNSGQNI